MDIANVLGGIAGLGLTVVGWAVARFHLGRRRADQVLATARYSRLENVGTVKRLTILPLIDWHTARDPSTGSGQGLTGETDVSYLVRADDTTILFDVGFKPAGRASFSPVTQYESPGCGSGRVRCAGHLPRAPGSRGGHGAPEAAHFWPFGPAG